MDNISLRPPKYNLKKKQPKSKNEYNNLKKNIKFIILQLENNLEEQRILLDIIDTINNKDIYLKIQTEITKNNSIENILFFINKNFIYSLNFKSKEILKKYFSEKVEEEEEVEDLDIFNNNINKINKNIDFSILGDMGELNIIEDKNNEKEYNEELIFSDEN
jgi:hypothetical protein